MPGKTNWISHAARKLGYAIFNTKGGGKSRIAGRQIAFWDFVQKIPLIILDPVGSTVDEFLDKVRRELDKGLALGQLTQKQVDEIWARIIYIEASGRKGRIVRQPALEQYEDESATDAAQRFVSILEMMQPSLRDAPVRGSVTLSKTLIHTVAVLLSFGYGIEMAQEFLTQTATDFKANWKQRLSQLQHNGDDGEVRKACRFFLKEYFTKSQYEKERITGSLLDRLTLLFNDDLSMVIHAGTKPAIDWQEVVDKRQAVLWDFRYQTNPVKRLFSMLLVYVSFREFLIRREMRAEPAVSFIIEELPELYGFVDSQNNAVFGAEIVKLLDEYSRRGNCWVTTLCQHIDQVDPRSLASLFSCIVAVGQVATHPQAEWVAQNFFAIDPHKVKKLTYSMVQTGGTTQHMIGDKMRYTPPPRYDLMPVGTVEYTAQEQVNQHSWMIKGNRAFEYLCKFPGLKEGDMDWNIGPAKFSNMNRGYWLDTVATAQTRDELSLIFPTFAKEKAKVLAFGSGSALLEAGQRQEDPASAKNAKAVAEPLSPQAEAELEAFYTALEALTELSEDTVRLLRGEDDATN